MIKNKKQNNEKLVFTVHMNGNTLQIQIKIYFYFINMQ